MSNFFSNRIWNVSHENRLLNLSNNWHQANFLPILAKQNANKWFWIEFSVFCLCEKRSICFIAFNCHVLSVKKEGVNTLSKIWNVLVNFGIFQKVSAILEGNFVDLNGLRFTFVLMFDFLTWSCKILANYSHIRNCMKFLSSFFRKTKKAV